MEIENRERVVVGGEREGERVVVCREIIELYVNVGILSVE